MKKLIVGSFVFVVALMLCTNVFAKTLEITEYNGENGLLDRSNPVGSGDVLNVMNSIEQSSYTYNNILSKGITIKGSTSTYTTYLYGGNGDGFYMDKDASSKMSKLTLTEYYGTILGVGALKQQEGDSVSAKLTLEDVNIYNNSGSIYVVGEGSVLNIVVSSDSYVDICGNSSGISVDQAKLNFKGGSVYLEDSVYACDGTLNNDSRLYYYNGMSLYDESKFNNNKILNNNGSINVYNDSVFNNKGEMYNYGTVYLGAGGRYLIGRASEPNALKYMVMEEFHPTYNNSGELYNAGEIVVDYGAIFNNNEYIDNRNAIAVLDGGLFNNKGTIDNNGGIFVYGQFENKGTINADGENYIYIGKDGGDTPRPPVDVLYEKAQRDLDEDLSQYAIFNNNGNLVYNYGLIDTDGILNNNGTLISNGSKDEDKFVTIYGKLNNKGKIDAKYLWLGSGKITGEGYVTGGTALRSKKIVKAKSSYDAPDVTPLLANYKTINVTEGIGGEDISYIYNSGTINLGGTYNEDFAGTLIVDRGTINLMADSLYFNAAQSHSYINGTLNLVNDTIDNVTMNNLYLEGTTKLHLDVELEDPAGDYLESDTVDGNLPKSSTISDDRGRFHITKINVMSDTEEKRTEVPIANDALQEYISLGQHRAFGIYEYKVIIISGTASSDQPTTVLQADDGTTGETEETEVDEKGSEFGNTLVFIRKDNKPRNPEILQSKVAIAGSNISQDEIFTTVFNNAGNYTFFQKQGTSAGDVEDRAAPTLWVKAFGSKEDVDLEEYTTIETTYYGAVVGLDWDRQYSDNFDATYGVFASYIGGELKDDEFGNKVDQSGGYIGVRGNWYIGKLFFNGIIDYALIQNGADTEEDNVDFNSQVAGLAARVGYNFEVANKSFTIQPNFGITGKYIMTDDYDTVVEGDKKKMEIDNITNITFEPGLKLIKNLGRCWILTGEGKYVIENVSGDVKYDSQVLPDTSYDNFGSVSLGIEKIWGYTVLHFKGSKTFGGRDGYILNAGIEFKF